LNDIILCFDKFSKALDELNDFIKNNINFQYNENFHNKINIDYKDWIIFKKIFQRYLDKDNDFRDKYNNICNIYVFGSRSKGNSLKFFDIDLYIDSDFFPIKDLKNDFDNSDLPFSVSIKSPKFFNYNSAKKDFIHLNILLKQ
jgi:predicted nucleotidyltransferase